VARTVLIAVCLITLVWATATSAVYANRRDWPQLKQFLFKRGRGIYGAPPIFWAGIALAALVRVLI
jgi:hypothetical protein